MIDGRSALLSCHSIFTSHAVGTYRSERSKYAEYQACTSRTDFLYRSRLLAGTGTGGGYGTRLARSFNRRPTPYRRDCVPNQDERRGAFSSVACSRKHRDLHPDLTARLRQYTDRRVPVQRCTRFAVAFGPPNLSKGNGPFEAWDELEYSVRADMPSVDKIYGHDYWAVLRRNPKANTANNGAMRSASVAMTPAVTAAYEWSQFSVIADIGGGIGTQLVSILDASPSSRGILFDQPHLGPESISHNRMEVIGGNFFESVPMGADAYLLRWILHDWAELEAAAILGSLRRAMKPTARLIVVENVIPEGASFHLGKWIDLQMLVCLRGRERTETEYRELLTAAGFDLQEVVATASPLSLLVAKPV